MVNEPNGLSRNSGDQLNYRTCPVCGDNRWKVYQDPSTGLWICFVCDARGKGSGQKDINTLHKMLRTIEHMDWPEVALPDTVPLSKMAKDYLRKRGIHDPGSFGISELEESTRVVFPYRGPYGRIIYWSSRYYLDDGKPKYLTCDGKHPLYVLPSWKPHEKAVLVEGIMDCIIHWLATGTPTIALGGKSLPKYLYPDLNYLAPGERTVMLDGEALAEGFKLARKIGAKIHPLPPGIDPADLFKGGK
jgi:hypothetical protein